MNIPLMKRIDASLGRLLANILPKSSKPGKRIEPRSILCIRPGGIGDAVLLAPSLAILKQHFPQAELIVLAEQRNVGVFGLIPSVDRVLRYDVAREFAAVSRLRPDLVIDTEQFHRLSAVVARLVGRTALRIGFATNERARLFHYPVAYSQAEYEAVSFYHLLAPLGIDQPDQIEAPFLTVPTLALKQAAALLAPLDNHRIVTFFPGASIAERRWGGERFRQVGFRLVQEGCKIVVVGGKEDAETGDAIVQGIGSGCLNLAGQTSLIETAAILARSNLLISGDSGVLHLAVGLGIPTVSLFGPGIADKWAPRGKGHAVLNMNLPCSPCTHFGTTEPCLRQAECLQQITSESVANAALLSLKQYVHVEMP